MRLSGKNPVIERLRANPQSIRKITMQQGFGDAAYIYKKAKQWNIPVISVPKMKMDKIGRNINTQGILIDIDDFAYTPFDDLIDLMLEKRLTPVFLDNIQDPQNLGAILRTLGCLGGFCVILPTHDSVSVTEAVMRVASGGENYVKVSRVGNLAQAMKRAKEEGYTIAGAVLKDGQPLGSVEFPRRIGFILGSEEKGIRDIHLKVIDLPLIIPMHLDRMSLNVAHATSIFAYETIRQKKHS